MNRMMLASILGEDYRILEAGNGKRCLELLRAKAGQISLVLLDINMPVMDGFVVLRTMNTNHTIEDVPVIMISSDDSEEAIRKAYELGASDYVNRPFDAKIVYRRVSNTIKLYAKQRRLVQMVSDQIRAREKNTDVLVGVLNQIVEFRNGESGSHVRHIRTISFVKVQSTSYEKYNDTITAKSLRRMAVSVRQLAENDALDIYDPEALRAETESLWLSCPGHGR